MQSPHDYPDGKRRGHPLHAGLSEAEREDFEERAGILEFEARISRPQAERMARQLVEERRR